MSSSSVMPTARLAIICNTLWYSYCLMMKILGDFSSHKTTRLSYMYHEQNMLERIVLMNTIFIVWTKIVSNSHQNLNYILITHENTCNIDDRLNIPNIMVKYIVFGSVQHVFKLWLPWHYFGDFWSCCVLWLTESISMFSNASWHLYPKCVLNSHFIIGRKLGPVEDAKDRHVLGGLQYGTQI
jgi:hypothetical protein